MKKTKKVIQLSDCSCDKWKESMSQVVNAQIFTSTHGIAYTGGIFLYCPWCGKKRKENNK